MSLSFDIKEETYYQQIVNLANVAIVKFDTELIIKDFTGSAEKIFGFKKKEVIGKTLFDTIVPKTESATGRDLEKLITNIANNIQHFQYNINENITKDGKTLWMQWQNSEIKDPTGKTIEFLSFGIDITDRRNMEATLKESEERFKTLSNLTFEGIIIHDNGIILDCNLSFEKQVGYSREELLGVNIIEKLIPENFKDIVKKNITQEVSAYEAEAIHKSGEIVPISIESKCSKIDNRCIRVAAVRNISELKKTIRELDNYKNKLEEIVKERTLELKNKNETLRFERNQLRTIIDNIPDTIYIKDIKSRFLNANKKELEYLKQQQLKDIVGKTDFDFYNKDFASGYFKDEQDILETGTAIINKEELCLNEHGETVYLSTTKVPLRDKNGEIIGIVGIGKDISDKKIADDKLKTQAKNLEERAKKIETLNTELTGFNKKLEFANIALQERKEELETILEQLKTTQTQLVQSEKMASLGVLVAGIAHEINNPVNFIYAGVNSVIRDFDDIESVISKINQLSDKTNTIKKFLDGFDKLKNEYELDVAKNAIKETLHDIKLGANRIKEIVTGLSHFSRLETENWKKANVHEEIDNVLILLKNKYKHHIEIIKNYDENLPMVDCYPGKLNQVFMNIINNSIDAIDKKSGKIFITSSLSNKNVYISIKDTGKGISENEKSKIFDPFYTTKDVGNGLGLGLSISYSIVQEHNGNIEVKSKQNEGTEFIISLPEKQ